MGEFTNKNFSNPLEEYASDLKALLNSDNSDFRDTFFERIKNDRQLNLHYTPNQFSALIANSVTRPPKSVLDICCGLGNVLFYLNSKYNDAQLEGIEINAAVSKMAALLIPDAVIHNSDAFKFEDYKKYDLIIANVPLGLRLNINGNRVSSEEAFAIKVLDLLNDNGEAFIITSSAFLTTGAMANTRLILQPHIKSVLGLPIANPTFTGVKRYLVHFTKSKVDTISFGSIDKFSQLKPTLIENTSLSIPKDTLSERLNPEYYISLNSNKYDFIDEFETKKLEDFAEILRGAYIKRERKKEEGHYLLIRPLDLKENRIHISDKSKYVDSIDSKIEERAIAQVGDIIISTAFNQGRIYSVKPNDPPIIVSNNMVILRGKDNDYLKVYFETEKGREFFKTQTEDLQTGAVIPQISISSLKGILIPIFPVDDINRWGDNTIEHSTKEELEQLKEQVSFYKAQLEEHKQQAISIDGFKQILENRDKKIFQELQKIGQKLDSIIEVLNSLQDDFQKIKSNNRDEEEKIFQMLSSLDRRIKSVLDEKRETIEEYEILTQRWLHLWEELHPSSKQFLPLAEYLYDELLNIKDADFSPFILQYCRTLENEILLKLFQKYHIEGLSGVDTDVLTKYDLNNNTKAAKFASYVKRNNTHYPLGDMHWILNLMKPKGSTYKNSPLLKHFRAFCTTYFQEEITGQEFLNQIQIIQREFRNKAAHVSTLNLASAEECRELLRKSLNEFLEMQIP